MTNPIIGGHGSPAQRHNLPDLDDDLELLILPDSDDSGPSSFNSHPLKRRDEEDSDDEMSESGSASDASSSSYTSTIESDEEDSFPAPSDGQHTHPIGGLIDEGAFSGKSAIDELCQWLKDQAAEEQDNGTCESIKKMERALKELQPIQGDLERLKSEDFCTFAQALNLQLKRNGVVYFPIKRGGKTALVVRVEAGKGFSIIALDSLHPCDLKRKRSALEEELAASIVEDRKIDPLSERLLSELKIQQFISFKARNREKVGDPAFFEALVRAAVNSPSQEGLEATLLQWLPKYVRGKRDEGPLKRADLYKKGWLEEEKGPLKGIWAFLHAVSIDAFFEEKKKRGNEGHLAYKAIKLRHETQELTNRISQLNSDASGWQKLSEEEREELAASSAHLLRAAAALHQEKGIESDALKKLRTTCEELERNLASPKKEMERNGYFPDLESNTDGIFSLGFASLDPRWGSSSASKNLKSQLTIVENEKLSEIEEKINRLKKSDDTIVSPSEFKPIIALIQPEIYKITTQNEATAIENLIINLVCKLPIPRRGDDLWDRLPLEEAERYFDTIILLHNLIVKSYERRIRMYDTINIEDHVVLLSVLYSIQLKLAARMEEIPITGDELFSYYDLLAGVSTTHYWSANLEIQKIIPDLFDYLTHSNWNIRDISRKYSIDDYKNESGALFSFIKVKDNEVIRAPLEFNTSKPSPTQDFFMKIVEKHKDEIRSSIAALNKKAEDRYEKELAAYNAKRAVYDALLKKLGGEANVKKELERLNGCLKKAEYAFVRDVIKKFDCPGYESELIRLASAGDSNELIKKLFERNNRQHDPFIFTVVHELADKRSAIKNEIADLSPHFFEPSKPRFYDPEFSLDQLGYLFSKKGRHLIPERLKEIIQLRFDINNIRYHDGLGKFTGKLSWRSFEARRPGEKKPSTVIMYPDYYRARSPKDFWNPSLVRSRFYAPDKFLPFYEGISFEDYYSYLRGVEWFRHDDNYLMRAVDDLHLNEEKKQQLLELLMLSVEPHLTLDRITSFFGQHPDLLFKHKHYFDMIKELLLRPGLLAITVKTDPKASQSIDYLFSQGVNTLKETGKMAEIAPLIKLCRSLQEYLFGLGAPETKEIRARVLEEIVPYLQDQGDTETLESVFSALQDSCIDCGNEKLQRQFVEDFLVHLHFRSQTPFKKFERYSLAKKIFHNPTSIIKKYVDEELIARVQKVIGPETTIRYNGGTVATPAFSYHLNIGFAEFTFNQDKKVHQQTVEELYAAAAASCPFNLRKEDLRKTKDGAVAQLDDGGQLTIISSDPQPLLLLETPNATYRHFTPDETLLEMLPGACPAKCWIDDKRGELLLFDDQNQPAYRVILNNPQSREKSRNKGKSPAFRDYPNEVGSSASYSNASVVRLKDGAVAVSLQEIPSPRRLRPIANFNCNCWKIGKLYAISITPGNLTFNVEEEKVTCTRFPGYRLVESQESYLASPTLYFEGDQGKRKILVLVNEEWMEYELNEEIDPSGNSKLRPSSSETLNSLYYLTFLAKKGDLREAKQCIDSLNIIYQLTKRERELIDASILLLSKTQTARGLALGLRLLLIKEVNTLLFPIEVENSLDELLGFAHLLNAYRSKMKSAGSYALTDEELRQLLEICFSRIIAISKKMEAPSLWYLAKLVFMGGISHLTEYCEKLLKVLQIENFCGGWYEALSLPDGRRRKIEKIDLKGNIESLVHTSQAQLQGIVGDLESSGFLNTINSQFSNESQRTPAQEEIIDCLDSLARDSSTWKSRFYTLYFIAREGSEEEKKQLKKELLFSSHNKTPYSRSIEAVLKNPSKFPKRERIEKMHQTLEEASKRLEAAAARKEATPLKEVIPAFFSSLRNPKMAYGFPPLRQIAVERVEYYMALKCYSSAKSDWDSFTDSINPISTVRKIAALFSIISTFWSNFSSFIDNARERKGRLDGRVYPIRDSFAAQETGNSEARLIDVPSQNELDEAANDYLAELKEEFFTVPPAQKLELPEFEPQHEDKDVSARLEAEAKELNTLADHLVSSPELKEGKALEALRKRLKQITTAADVRLYHKKRELIETLNSIDPDREDYEELALQRKIEGKELLWRDLIQLTLMGCHQEFAEKTALTEKQVEDLMQETVIYLVEATRNQQIRAIQEKVVKAIEEEDGERKKLLLREIALMLDSKRGYNPAADTLSKLWFEANNGYLYRDDQLRMLLELSAEEFNHLLSKMPTGFGKTKTMVPSLNEFMATLRRLILEKAKRRLICNIHPEAIAEINTKDNQEQMKKSSARPVARIEFKRTTPITVASLRKTFDELQRYRNEGIPINISAETVRSLQLHFIEQLDKFSSTDSSSFSSQAQREWEEENRELISLFIRILRAFRTTGWATIDEAHVNINPIDRLIYTLGSPQPLPLDHVVLIEDLFRWLCNNGYRQTFVDRTQQKIEAKELREIGEAFARSYARKLEISEAREEEYMAYLFNDEEKIPEWVKKHERREQIDLLRGELASLLKDSFAGRPNVDFGFSKEHFDTKEFAISYYAARSPKETPSNPNPSEFKNPHVALNKTYLTYIVNGLTQKQQVKMFKKLKADHLDTFQITKNSDTPENRLFKLLCPDLDTPLSKIKAKQMPLLAKDIQHNDEAIFYYIRAIVAPQIMIYPESLVSTAQNFRGQFAAEVSITATPPHEATHGPDTVSSKTDHAAGRLNYLLLTKIRDENIHIVPATTSRQMLGAAIETLRANPRYKALIDTSALLADEELSNKEVAKALLDAQLPGIHAVCYFDEEKKDFTYLIDQNAANGKSSLDPSHLITYFDQARCTGSDRVLDPFCSGLQLLNGKAAKDEVAQGAGRMRGLSNGQGLGLLMAEGEITFTEDAPKNVQLFTQWVANQMEVEKRNNYMSITQQMDQEIRGPLLDSMMGVSIVDGAPAIVKEAPDVDHAVALFTKFRREFVTPNKTSATALYSGTRKKIKTPKALDEYHSTCLERANKLGSLKKRAKAELAKYPPKWNGDNAIPLPAKVEPPGNVDREAQVEAEIMQQQELQIQHVQAIAQEKQSDYRKTYLWRDDIDLFERGWETPKNISSSRNFLDRLFLGKLRAIYRFIFDTRGNYNGLNYSDQENCAYKVQDVMARYLPSKYRKVERLFSEELLASNNFYTQNYYDWKSRPIVPFSKEQKRLYNVLVIQDVDKKVKLMLLNNYDSSYFSERLKNDRLYTDEEEAKNRTRKIGLLSLHSGKIISGKNGFEEGELEGNMQFSRLLAQAKLINGEVDYSEDELDYLSAHAGRIGKVLFTEFIYQHVLPRRAKQRQLYSYSQLNQRVMSIAADVESG